MHGDDLDASTALKVKVSAANMETMFEDPLGPMDTSYRGSNTGGMISMSPQEASLGGISDFRSGVKADQHGVSGLCPLDEGPDHPGRSSVQQKEGVAPSKVSLPGHTEE